MLVPVIGAGRHAMGIHPVHAPGCSKGAGIRCGSLGLRNPIIGTDTNALSIRSTAPPVCAMGSWRTRPLKGCNAPSPERHGALYVLNLLRQGGKNPLQGCYTLPWGGKRFNPPPPYHPADDVVVETGSNFKFPPSGDCY